MGVLGFITMLAFYPIWKYPGQEIYENLPLRIIGAIVCLFIALHNFWPEKIKKRYFLLYYVLAGTYCFPFFCTYMAIRNEFSIVWSLTVLTAVFALIVAVNWITNIIMLVLGMSSAFFLFFFQFGSLNVPGIKQFFYFLPVYIFTYIIGTFFSYRSDLDREEKDRLLSLQSSYISHELQRPITGAQFGIKELIYAYKERNDEKFVTMAIRTQSELKNAQEIFEIILKNVSLARINRENFDDCSIFATIECALENYPFVSDKERRKVLWVSEENTDFYYRGRETLTVYVIYNLVKNALTALRKTGGGKIWIETYQGKRYNIMKVCDNGPGIPLEHQAHIFKRYYTTAGETFWGAGLGLSYVQNIIQSYSGKVNFKSEENHTEFTLRFPVIHSP